MAFYHRIKINNGLCCRGNSSVYVFYLADCFLLSVNKTKFLIHGNDQVYEPQCYCMRVCESVCGNIYIICVWWLDGGQVYSIEPDISWNYELHICAHPHTHRRRLRSVLWKAWQKQKHRHWAHRLGQRGGVVRGQLVGETKTNLISQKFPVVVLWNTVQYLQTDF